MCVESDFLADPYPPESFCGQRMTSRTKWSCADGTRVAIRDMDNGHLSNVIAWLERQPDEIIRHFFPAFGEPGDYELELVEWSRNGFTKAEWLEAFRKEAKRRMRAIR